MTTRTNAGGRKIWLYFLHTILEIVYDEQELLQEAGRKKEDKVMFFLQYIHNTSMLFYNLQV